MFCIAARKLGQSAARLSSHSASALRSSGIVKVAESAKTYPGSAAPDGRTSESTGPCRVVRIDPLDKEVLDIRRCRRQAPGDALIVADQDKRAARRGPAGDFVLRRLQ